MFFNIVYTVTVTSSDLIVMQFSLLVLHQNQIFLYEISLDEILKQFVCRTAQRKCIFGKA